MENTEITEVKKDQTALKPIEKIKSLMTSKGVAEKFKELLGEKSQGFITSVLQVVNGNDKLKNADANSIYGAAAAAAVLDLPINNNFGFAYIVPYGGIAQFQMGYKGFIQLAQRSGQYKNISATAIYEGQLIEENPLTGFVFDFKAKKSDKIIGYAAYFSLISGFEKVLYMPIDEVSKHAKKYSKTYGKSDSRWTIDFDAMATKTVLKLLISKYGPLSIAMQKALTFDQSKVNNVETEDVEYIDNDNEPIALDPEDLQALLDMKREALTEEEIANAERILTKKETASYPKLLTLLQSK